MNYYCNQCKIDISYDEYKYSMKHFEKALCRKCQNLKNNNNSTPEAEKLFKALKKRGVPAKQELFDGFKHIDIAIPEARVNIEVDGGHHNYSHKQALADLKRTFYSFKKGYLTLRIPNSLIKNHLEETADYITEFLNESLEQMEEYFELY